MICISQITEQLTMNSMNAIGTPDL